MYMNHYNDTKCGLSAYGKGPTVGYQYNFTLSPFFLGRVGVPHGACISLTLFNIFTSTFSQPDNLLSNSYADDFTVSCSNVAQMADVHSAHSPNIEE